MRLHTSAKPHSTDPALWEARAYPYPPPLLAAVPNVAAAANTAFTPAPRPVAASASGPASPLFSPQASAWRVCISSAGLKAQLGRVQPPRDCALTRCPPCSALGRAAQTQQLPAQARVSARAAGCQRKRERAPWPLIVGRGRLPPAAYAQPTREQERPAQPGAQYSNAISRPGGFLAARFQRVNRLEKFNTWLDMYKA